MERRFDWRESFEWLGLSKSNQGFFSLGQKDEWIEERIEFLSLDFFFFLSCFFSWVSSLAVIFYRPSFSFLLFFSFFLVSSFFLFSFFFLSRSFFLPSWISAWYLSLLPFKLSVHSKHTQLEWLITWPILLLQNQSSNLLPSSSDGMTEHYLCPHLKSIDKNYWFFNYRLELF